MSPEIQVRLLAILATIALGALLTRVPALRRPRAGEPDAATAALALAQIATYLLIPALLFRTMVRMDLRHLPWPVVHAYFVPLMVCAIALVQIQGRRPGAAAAVPATRATAALYGNAVQLGVPMAAAMFGERGLAIHVALVSLHGVLVLTLLTLQAEYALARSGPARPWGSVLASMLRGAVLHPVVLPVLLGLAWNLAGAPWPALADQVLGGLGVAVVPLCLLLIGMNLAQYGLRGAWRPALPLVLVKLLAVPALVLVAARWGFGLRGLPLQVAVMMGALPVGANALIMAQRYRVLQAEATVAIVLSTLAFAATAPAWLWVLAQLA